MFFPFGVISFCDGMCNVAECGYDAGDCGGDENLSRLPRLSANYSTSVGHYSVQMASGATVAVWNLSRAFQQFDLVGVEIDSDRKAAGIRSDNSMSLRLLQMSLLLLSSN